MNNKKKSALIDRLKKLFSDQGFTIGDGLKYGTDLLLYTDSPDNVHSKYAVLINTEITFLQLLAAQRICNSCKKELIIVDIVDDNIIMHSVTRFLPKKYFGE